MRSSCRFPPAFCIVCDFPDFTGFGQKDELLYPFPHQKIWVPLFREKFQTGKVPTRVYTRTIPMRSVHTSHHSQSTGSDMEGLYGVCGYATVESQREDTSRCQLSIVRRVFPRDGDEKLVRQLHISKYLETTGQFGDGQATKIAREGIVQVRRTICKAISFSHSHYSPFRPRVRQFRRP